MKVAFRVDASVVIGSGHVMRCLTLAAVLRERGAQCHFVCREHIGNLIQQVRDRGFEVDVLTGLSAAEGTGVTGHTDAVPAHASWLGSDWQTDADQTRRVLGTLQPDWLVVDHYGLDAQWENHVRSNLRKLLVLDDLADRPHACDLLLDQNLGRQASDYLGLVPESCKLLVGPDYALLRPEFAALRELSLKRRQSAALANILVTMGGVDQPNASGRVLQALALCDLPPDCRISVVMGSHAPWTEEVQALAKRMPWRTEVLVNVSDMGRRMADSDLAIGAAGSTSWERCCLGLPTLMVVLAANQIGGAAALANARAAVPLGGVEDIATKLPTAISDIAHNDRLIQMSLEARSIVDGRGAERLMRAMES